MINNHTGRLASSNMGQNIKVGTSKEQNPSENRIWNENRQLQLKLNVLFSSRVNLARLKLLILLIL